MIKVGIGQIRYQPSLIVKNKKKIKRLPFEELVGIILKWSSKVILQIATYVNKVYVWRVTFKEFVGDVLGLFNFCINFLYEIDMTLIHHLNILVHLHI